MEEIASRFVEIEVSSEDREILYRVITYYKDGRVDQELRRMGEGFDKEEMEVLLQVLGGGSLRDGIASLIGGQAQVILEGKRQIEEIRIKGEEEQIEK
jgi:hypothetical protein